MRAAPGRPARALPGPVKPRPCRVKSASWCSLCMRVCAHVRAHALWSAVQPRARAPGMCTRVRLVMAPHTHARFGCALPGVAVGCLVMFVVCARVRIPWCSKVNATSLSVSFVRRARGGLVVWHRLRYIRCLRVCACTGSCVCRISRRCPWVGARAQQDLVYLSVWCDLS